MATGFETSLNPPFSVLCPAEQRVPFVFNSPHSGRNYTPEFLALTRLSRSAIRKSEDFRVDELFGGALAQGAPLLAANFPRAFLDVNREPYELDPAMFEGELPDYVNARTSRVAGGLGTIARIVSENDSIYARPLAVAVGLERIETLYKPYHGELRRLLARTHVRFGHAILVDCHSMPSNRERGSRKLRPDFVIGDRFGTSCAQHVTWAAFEFLTALGFQVEINKPYAGGFITEHYGRPDNGIHAIQLEVNRGLYMNETTLEKKDDFAALAHLISQFIARFVSIPDADLAGTRPIAAE
ncbi:MAG: N-formylglutamate amidohydrolase [Rhizobiaceae bacterium]